MRRNFGEIVLLHASEDSTAYPAKWGVGCVGRHPEVV